ncbi:MAG: hypothetical protein ACRDUW_05080 [Pseudonocardiaceae bacterium]
MGATIVVHRSYVYAARPALSEWADWCIGVVERGDGDYSEVQRAAVKHWARALVGKFATRYTPWEPFGRSMEYGVEQHPIFDMDTQRLGKMLTVGDDAFVGWEALYSSDAFPAVMAVVMAEARVRLWTLMQIAGTGTVAYVDTDSLIVNEEGSAALDAFVRDHGGWGLRLKGTYKRLTILGPRQLVVNGQQRIAGVPRKATNAGHGKWVGETWQGLNAAFNAGTTNRVIITPADWQPKGTDKRRLHLPGGLTAPMTIHDADEMNATR